MHARNDEARGEGAAETVRGSTRRFRGLGWLLGVLVGLSLSLPGCLGALGGVGGLEWKEEVALQDGRIIVATWQMQLVSGEPFQSMAGARRLTFTDPTTGQLVVWENAGRTGSRLSPTLLDVDGDRLFFVGRAQSGTDYDGFSCPTPPYIVFRYEAGTWVRVTLNELPARLWKANLLGYPGEDVLRVSKYYITAAQVEARFDALRKRGDIEHYGRIDRRLRNPMGEGCSRDAIEKLFGVEKYSKWRKTGNWLDKTEAEALKLLRRKDEGAKP
jgi:hypothetical protein